MKIIAILVAVLACSGCAQTPQADAESAVGGNPSVREQLQVPDGVMLCMVKYPPKAPPEVAERFHATMQKLNGALASSKIEYNVTGYLANMFYIRSDHAGAKKVINQSMANEPFEVEYH